MKGKGYKQNRGGGQKQHKQNTKDTVRHILSTLYRFGPCTLQDLRYPLEAEFRRRRYAQADAYDVATARLKRGVGVLRRSKVSCIGIKYPSIMTSKNDLGTVVYTLFEDWTVADLQSHQQIQTQNRRDCTKREITDAAKLQKLESAMEEAGVSKAGELDWQRDFDFDE